MVLIAAWLAFAGTERPAHAEGSPAAEALFRDGRAAMKSGDWEKARAKFAESQRLDPAPGTLLNLAAAEEKLGKLASAWEHAHAASLGFSAGDERLPVAKKLYENVNERLPHLTLRAKEPLPEAVRLSVDGTELSLASVGVALPADPGAHRILVRAPNRNERAYEVTLVERQNLVVTVEPGSASPVVAPSPSPAPAPNVTSSGSGWRTAGFVLLGVGGAGLVAGGVLGGLAIDRNGTVEDRCTKSGCDQTGVDASEEGRTFATASTIAFIAGTAVALGGVVVLVLAPKSERVARLRTNGAGAMLDVSF